MKFVIDLIDLNKRPPSRSYPCHLMALALIRQPLIADGRPWTQAIPCALCGLLSGTGTDINVIRPVFHFNLFPYSWRYITLAVFNVVKQHI